MTASLGRGTVLGALVGLGAAALGARAALPPCAELFVGDAFADPGVGASVGAALGSDLDLPVDANTVTVGGSDLAVFLSHVAAGPGREAFLSDADADPSLLGPDPGGNLGRGAVFAVDGPAGTSRLVADGTACGASLPACGPEGVFVDPVAVAWSHALDLLVVVDLDADPSALGLDSAGFPGHGAVLSVDPVTGQVELVADGSLYPPGIPGGAPSVFEDPVSAGFADDGTLYVVDQLADPTGSGTSGAVFSVDVATGTVGLVAQSPLFVGPRDVAAEPGGTLLVLDRLAGGNGTLFRVDPTGPPASNVVTSLSSPDFVEPSGLSVAGNGTVYLLDASADPTLQGFAGAVFAIDPALSAATPVSSTADFVFPWSLELAESLSLDAAAPASAGQGQVLTVALAGGTFDVPPVADFGAGVSVDAVRVAGPTQLDVDLTIAAGAAPGWRDVRVTHPDGREGLRCALFEVLPSVGCTPAAAIADTLRLTRPFAGTVQLTWASTGDPCAVSFRVYRADTAWPTTLPGGWPVDPPFADITATDSDGSDLDATFSYPFVPATNEHYLVVELGSSGAEGPAGHYGP